VRFFKLYVDCYQTAVAHCQASPSEKSEKRSADALLVPGMFRSTSLEYVLVN
jgi:hypothetical protein